MRLRPALTPALILLAIADTAECTQTPSAAYPKLESGAHIRFDARSLGDHLIGTLVEVQPDTLMVNIDGDARGLALIVPTDSITRLELSRERRLTLEGLGLGVISGVAVALIADPNVVDENRDCTTLECLSYQVSPHLDTRITVLGLTGALLGTIIGAETRITSWANVPLQRLQIGPTHDGGVALGVRISF